MDIPHAAHGRAVLIHRFVYAGVALLAIGVAVYLAFAIRRAIPSVDRSAVWTGVVKRGPMIRQVRGSGTLVPERIRWVTAAGDGRVETILVQPGTPVQTDTVLLELSNPELEKAVLDAQWQLKSAEAELATRKVQLQNALLDMEATLARLKAEREQVRLQRDVDEKLYQDGLLSERSWRLSTARVSQVDELMGILEQQNEIKRQSQPAELAVHEARIAQAKAMCDFKVKSFKSLSVRSGTEGVLQQWEENVQVGRQITPGTALAKICDPSRLKAVIRVPEVQARDVQIGQKAEVSTGDTVIAGTVARIDPAAQEGTVTVDLALPGPLPKAARPDLTVVGTIEIERLENVLFMNRPANSQPGMITVLFRVDDGTADAVRVKLGISSVNAIQVIEGLQEGDTVILSDMSLHEGTSRIRLK